MWGDTGTQGDGKMGGDDDWGYSTWQGGDHSMELLSRIHLLIAVLSAVGTVACAWWLLAWLANG